MLQARHRPVPDTPEAQAAAPVAASPALERAMPPPQLQNHPLRHVLSNELHARPFVALSAPARVSYLALHTGEQGGETNDKTSWSATITRCGAPTSAAVTGGSTLATVASKSGGDA